MPSSAAPSRLRQQLQTSANSANLFVMVEKRASLFKILPPEGNALGHKACSNRPLY